MRSSWLCIAFPFLGVGLTAADHCRCGPSDSCWPSATEWNALNKTVSGRLISSAPPASVCYRSEPNYNESACNFVLTHWNTSSFHSGNPVSVPSAWTNSSCEPIFPNGTSIRGDPDAGNTGCSIGFLPPYVVNATEAVHVHGALKFARKWNLRVTIKNTGHNGAGRNTGYGSLSIWTHHMKDIQFHKDFQTCDPTKTRKTGQMAATLGAGVQDGELYKAMIEKDAIAVGGTHMDVGVVGWATGGGHGVMTGHFGQGADNILEAVIVTADGEVVTANACQNEDLFWAIRGGGGGTFGVIVSMTVKAYPMPKMTIAGIDIAAKNGTSSKAWWNLIAQVHGLLPDLEDQGVHGYYTIKGPPSSSTLHLTGSLFLWNGANGTFENATRPIQELLSGANDIATFSLTPVPIPTFADLIRAFPNFESVGTTKSITASRLITRRTVSEKQDLLAETFEKVGPKAIAPSDGLPNPSVSGTMTISRKTVDNALNPAWRDTVVHFITSRSWKDTLPESDVTRIVDDMTYNKLNALRELDPNSGAYLNEANTLEPGWQWSFFGPNYGRLLAIKNKYDPEGLLWCPQCVGSEDWFQEKSGRLCRAYIPF